MDADRGGSDRDRYGDVAMSPGIQQFMCIYNTDFLSRWIHLSFFERLHRRATDSHTGTLTPIADANGDG